MKKAFIYLYLIIVFLLFVFTVDLQKGKPAIMPPEQMEEGDYEFIDGTIQKVLPLNTDDGEAKVFVFKAKSGDEKGGMFEARLSDMNSNFNSYMVGQDVQIYKFRDVESGIYRYEIADYNHKSGLLWIVIIFVLFSIFIARMKGVTAIISIAVSLSLFYFIFMKMIMYGYSPFISCIFFVIMVTWLTIPLIHGFNKKSLSAILSIMAGYFFSAIISFLFIRIVHLGAAPDEDFRLLAINYPQLQLSSLLFASLFIGAIGAIIDTAISISSAVFEGLKAHEHNFMSAYRIGMEIGKDVLGSMTNTLLFAYLASSLPFFVIITLNERDSFAGLMNFDFIALELTRTFIGAISLVFLIPITASISSYYLIKIKNI